MVGKQKNLQHSIHQQGKAQPGDRLGLMMFDEFLNVAKTHKFLQAEPFNLEFQNKVLSSGFWRVVDAGDTAQTGVRGLRREWRQSSTGVHFWLELEHRDP